MKEVLCIMNWNGKPYFHFRNGERYGPAKNEVCTVLETLIWDAYPNERYYRLQGYDNPDSRFRFGFPVFRAVYFVDLISDQALAEELTNIEYEQHH